MLYLILLIGCECPTKIDTDRVIKPTNSAKVIFVNLTDSSSINIFSGNIHLLKNFNESNTSNYIDFLSGNEYIKVSDKSQKILTNESLLLNKSSYNTIFFFNYYSFYKLSKADDDLILQNNKPLIRFFNFHYKYNNVIFNLYQNGILLNSIIANFSEGSQFESIDSGEFELKIIDHKTQLEISSSNIIIEDNAMLSLIYSAKQNKNLLTIKHFQK